VKESETGELKEIKKIREDPSKEFRDVQRLS
jgi:hypothetical protein